MNMSMVVKAFPVLALLFTSSAAFGFYDPAAQRWVNRDLLGESGFEVIRKGLGSIPSNQGNCYLFVHNRPTVFIDPDGLDFVDNAVSFGAGLVDALISDYIACVGKCVEQKDPVNQWLTRLAHAGCPIPYTPLRKMGWPQKIGTRLTNLLSMAHESGLGGRWLRVVGRGLSPANTLYGWWMVGKEVECAAECSGNLTAY